MSGVTPKGEKTRKAVRWISDELKEDETKSVMRLVEKASERFNLSPKEEEFLREFYRKDGPDDTL